MGLGPRRRIDLAEPGAEVFVLGDHLAEDPGHRLGPRPLWDRMKAYRQEEQVVPGRRLAVSPAALFSRTKLSEASFQVRWTPPSRMLAARSVGAAGGMTATPVVPPLSPAEPLEVPPDVSRRHPSARTTARTSSGCRGLRHLPPLDRRPRTALARPFFPVRLARGRRYTWGRHRPTITGRRRKRRDVSIRDHPWRPPRRLILHPHGVYDRGRGPTAPTRL